MLSIRRGIQFGLAMSIALAAGQRVENPMNGDGHNYGINLAIKKIASAFISGNPKAENTIQKAYDALKSMPGNPSTEVLEAMKLLAENGAQ